MNGVIIKYKGMYTTKEAGNMRTTYTQSKFVSNIICTDYLFYSLGPVTQHLNICRRRRPLCANYRHPLTTC